MRWLTPNALWIKSLPSRFLCRACHWFDPVCFLITELSSKVSQEQIYEREPRCFGVVFFSMSIQIMDEKWTTEWSEWIIAREAILSRYIYHRRVRQQARLKTQTVTLKRQARKRKYLGFVNYKPDLYFVKYPPPNPAIFISNQSNSNKHTLDNSKPLIVVAKVGNLLRTHTMITLN